MEACLVYSDLLLDDLCAIQKLSSYFKDMYLVPCDIQDDYAENDYSPANRSVPEVIELIRGWFRKVSVAENINGKLDGVEHVFILARATEVVADIRKNDWMKELQFCFMGGSYPGLEAENNPDNLEWNHSRDRKAYTALFREFDLDITQFTFKDCEELADMNDTKMQFYQEYVETMERLGDSTCCPDLSAVTQYVAIKNIMPFFNSIVRWNLKPICLD